MLSNFSQFAPQGLTPQIPGLQGIGVPQPNSGLGQPGIYGNAWAGHELGQQVPNWAGQVNPFGHNPLLHGQGTPYAQLQSSIQMVPVLAQLAQQLTIQCAITQQFAQQVSAAIQQLANQLSVQGLQGQYYGQNPLTWGANRQPTIQ